MKSVQGDKKKILAMDDGEGGGAAEQFSKNKE